MLYFVPGLSVMVVPISFILSMLLSQQECFKIIEFV